MALNEPDPTHEFQTRLLLMKSLLFGSIGSVVETSEAQRESFNQAFLQHGLDWHWDRDQYRDLLQCSGGRHRIAHFAETRGEQVDASAVHQTKSKIFQTSIRTGNLKPRDGVQEVIELAKNSGIRLAMVTTTSRENVQSLLTAMSESIPANTFEIVVDAEMVEENKPDDECYRIALRELNVDAADCLAIEDNVDGVKSATDAGIKCIAFPGANTQDHDYTGAELTTDSLAKTIQSLLPNTPISAT